MVRKIDDLGRVVIPAETRRLFQIHEGDPLSISIQDDGILIRKLEATCVFCGALDDVRNFRGRGLCGECRREITRT